MPTSRTIAKREENRVPTLIGVASTTVTIGDTNFVQDVTPVPVAVNPVTGAILIENA